MYETLQLKARKIEYCYFPLTNREASAILITFNINISTRFVFSMPTFFNPLCSTNLVSSRVFPSPWDLIIIWLFHSKSFNVPQVQA